MSFILIRSILNLIGGCLDGFFSLVSCLRILNQLCTTHFERSLQNVGPYQQKVVLMLTAAIRKKVSYLRLGKRTKRRYKIKSNYASITFDTN